MENTAIKKDSPFACVMDDLTPEQRERIFALLDKLKAKKQEIKELPDGYAFRCEILEAVVPAADAFFKRYIDGVYGSGIRVRVGEFDIVRGGCAEDGL
jgi:hypothetical protein